MCRGRQGPGPVAGFKVMHSNTHRPSCWAPRYQPHPAQGTLPHSLPPVLGPTGVTVLATDPQGSASALGKTGHCLVTQVR